MTPHDRPGLTLQRVPPGTALRNVRRPHALVGVLTLITTGCASTLVATRPLSEHMLARMNETIHDRRAIVVLAQEPESRTVRKQAVQVAARDSKETGQSVPGQRSQAIRDDLAARSLEATEVKVGHEMTSWMEVLPSAGEARARSVPTAALQQITVRSRGRGAAEGLGLGLLVGLSAGAATGALLGGHSNCLGCGAATGAFVLGVAGGVVGMSVGLAVGAVVGHRTSVDFHDSPARSP
jgi:hypothetical protein